MATYSITATLKLATDSPSTTRILLDSYKAVSASERTEHYVTLSPGDTFSLTLANVLLGSSNLLWMETDGVVDVSINGGTDVAQYSSFWAATINNLTSIEVTNSTLAAITMILIIVAA